MYFSGGIHADEENIFSITNSLLANNTADSDGGGVANRLFTQLTMSNCTVAYNTVIGADPEGNREGGGLYLSDGVDANVINSIFWGNLATFGRQIGLSSGDPIDPAPSTITVSYSDVQGSQAGIEKDPNCTINWDANSNINLNPRFVTGPLGSEPRDWLSP